jgi:small subunit ribosomal protein S4
MTKRSKRKYQLLNFYEEDFFGTLVLKDPKYSETYWEGYKNLKINNILLEKIEERVERRLYFKKHGKRQEFYYRIDIGKPKRKRRRLSIFGIRLKFRQKIRKFASQMNVRQFRMYIKKSLKFNKLYLIFLKYLESRLDFLIYRMNFVNNSREGRFLINHGNFLVNGKQTFFPSQQIESFQIITVLNKNFFYKKILENILNFNFFINIPLYIEMNYRILSGVLIFIPMGNQIPYPSKMKSEIFASIGKRFKG